MQVTLLHRVKDAVRFYEANANSTWFLGGHPTAWSPSDPGGNSGTSDSNPPTPPLTTVSIISPAFAMQATVLLVYEAMTQELISLGGTATPGETVQFQIAGSFTGSPQTISYGPLGGGDNLTTTAAGLATNLNTNTACINAGITALASGTTLVVSYSNIYNLLTFTNTSAGGNHESLTFTNMGNSGVYSYKDSNNNIRKFSAFPSVAAAVAGNCTEVLLTATVSGSQVQSSGITSFRQLGFASDLSLNVGQSGPFVIASQVANWGQLESIHNRVPMTLDPESNYTCQHIVDY